MSAPIRLVIAGAAGRMGQAIARCALADSVFEIGGAFEMRGHAGVGTDYGTWLGQPSPLGVRMLDDAKAAIGRGDVIVTFTLPEATIEHVKLAQE